MPRLRALTTHFPNANVCELTPAKLMAFFQRGAASKKSFNNRRGLVSAFLKYGLLQDWIAVATVPRSGSEISRCTCRGITTKS